MDKWIKYLWFAVFAVWLMASFMSCEIGRVVDDHEARLKALETPVQPRDGHETEETPNTTQDD